MALVLTRKAGEKILCGEEIEIEVVKIVGNRVRIALRGPETIKFLRAEIVDRGGEKTQTRKSA